MRNKNKKSKKLFHGSANVDIGSLMLCKKKNNCGNIYEAGMICNCYFISMNYATLKQEIKIIVLKKSLNDGNWKA